MLVSLSVCNADTIHLKDGRTISSKTVWLEENFYKYIKYGATIGISKEKVQKVVYTKKKLKSEFQFDVWPFGISVQESIVIAEQNNIPFQRYGIISMNKQFHHQVKKYSNSTHFQYKDVLFGHPAVVELLYTPTSKILYKVKVKWYNHNSSKKKLEKEIISIISGKYGKHEKPYRQLFKHFTTKWSLKSSNKIIMDTGSNYTFLTYLHQEFSDLSFAEKETIEYKTIKVNAEKDQEKF
jgi:hypothetical protein